MLVRGPRHDIWQGLFAETPPRESKLSASELERRGALLLRVAHVMGALGAFAFLASLLEPKNSKLVSVVFYSIVGLGVWTVARLAKGGRVVAAAWILCSFFWLLITFAVLFCGGMQGENAATFIVCVMLIGSVVGGRAAMVVALFTSFVCLLLAYLERGALLPPQLASYSPISAWIAVTVTLILTSVLLRASLESLERAHAQAERSAGERDRALAKSIEAQKMEVVGNLSSGIAHDFNNLLMVISGSAQLLRAQLGSAGEDSQRILDDINAATSRATMMTRQLLSFGGGRVDDRSAIDLAEVVCSMSAMLPRLLGSRIAVRVETPSERVAVLASRAGLEQILLNLSVNARDAMLEGGELQFQLQLEAGFAVLRAKDTGHGMSAEILARAFDPFFTTKSLGTGLGLATVLARVEQFGGSIQAESAPGNGSEFVVRLPLAPVGAVQPASIRPNPIEPGFRGRALLVEDDGLVRRTLGRMLEISGFEVTAVANGLEALGVLQESSGFALVLTDLAMPRLGGHALLEQLSERFPALPVVAISGNPEVEPKNAGLDLPVLHKPVEQAALVQAIRCGTNRATTSCRAPGRS